MGIEVLARHRAPTPIGTRVYIRAELIEVRGDQLRFRAELWDDVEPIGEAEHRRAVIDVERFLRRVEAKATRVGDSSRR